MTQDKTQNYRSIKNGAGIGTLIGFCLLPVAFITSFTICPDSTYASWLFPFAVFADPTLVNHPLLALVLALIQYPIYGIICGYVWKRKNSLPVVALMLLFAVHVIAISGAMYRIDHIYENYPIEIR